jgi:hypothetical protein
MAKGELSILSEYSDEKSMPPSRRSILKYGSLGVAGAAGLVATGGALMVKRAHAAEPASSSIVGIWQGTVTYTAGLILPPFHATFLFSADGNAMVTSDVERLPALQSGMGFGRWKDMGNNQFQYSLVKQGVAPVPSDLVGPTYNIASTLTLSSDGSNFTASGKRLKLSPAGIQLLEIPFNVTAKRLADPGAA